MDHGEDRRQVALPGSHEEQSVDGAVGNQPWPQPPRHRWEIPGAREGCQLHMAFARHRTFNVLDLFVLTRTETWGCTSLLVPPPYNLKQRFRTVPLFQGHPSI